MEKFITFFGQKAKIGCDEKCNKAWGNNSRPKEQLTDDEDDYCFLSDNELEEAPIDPGTYEGGQAKPTNKAEMLNKWCARECERCVMSKPNEYDKPLVFADWNERVYNIPR